MAERVTILAVVGQHSVFGVLENHGLRVADVLNDHASEFIHLRDVTVRRQIDGAVVEQIREATIRKASLDFILLEKDKHEAPLRRQHARVDKPSYTTFILLGDYEIRGTIMLRGSPEVTAVLNRELSAFFPVIGPHLSKIDSAGEPISSGVAILNKSKVSVIHFQPE